MSVGTEIERLNASKNAIAQAIRDKGVDVPGDAKIDTFADYVAMIGATSGIPVTFNGNPVVATGTIANQPFEGLKIYGKSTQDGTPSPSNPVPIVNAGASGSIALTITDGADQSQSLTISTTNGLPGIPVSSGGTFTDSTGQQWVCDEVDYSAGKYIQNVFYGRITKVDSRSTNSNYINLFYAKNGFKNPKSTNSNVLSGSISNLFKEKTIPDFSGQAIIDGFNAYTYLNNPYIAISLATKPEINTVELMNQWLAENELYVCYQLETPIESDLSPEEIAAYNALTTYADTTVISTAEPVAGMEAKLYCDAEKTIDRKVSEGIAAAVKLSGGNT